MINLTYPTINPGVDMGKSELSKFYMFIFKISPTLDIIILTLNKYL